MGWCFVGNIVIHATGEFWDEEAGRMSGSHRELGEFYAALLGVSVIRDDWVKVGRDRRTFPQIALDGVKDGIQGSAATSSYRPPRWPDPGEPQHIHLDIEVADVEVASRIATTHGASLLHDNGDHRVFADPAGHPFCLYRAEDLDEVFGEISFDFSTGTVAERRVDGGAARIARAVIDCDDPNALARFYVDLLDMELVQADDNRVMVARRDRLGLQLALQRVPDYRPPRLGDDANHQQVHLDLWFEDAADARDRAERLGATKTPHPRGNVYADPAGHPMCLLAVGQ